MKFKYVLLVVIIFFLLSTLSFLNVDSNINVNNSENNNFLKLKKVGSPHNYTVMTDIPPEPTEDIKRITSLDVPMETTSDLPNNYNWEDINGSDYTTPVRNQGTCGSCWAFSAIAMIESKINIKYGSPSLDVDLSEQYILSCLPNAGNCGGGWTSTALNLILDDGPNGNYINGVTTESCFPYASGSNGQVPSCQDKCDDWADNLWQISDYGTYYFSFGESGWNQLKQKLIEDGPLGVNFLATDDFKNWGYSNHDSDDFYPYTGYTNSINHAVILVGYKDDPSIDNGGYWICKNSWGSGFGYGGFFNIEYGALNIDNTAYWVDIPQGIDVDFSYSPNIVTKNEVVNFNVICSSEISSYWWDFGDGYYSDLQNPKHCFYENGIYDVSLIITTNLGSVGSVIKQIEVPTGLILADFSYNPDNPTTQDTINFYDQSQGSTIVSYLWEFGDGYTSNSKNTTHLYSDDGLYQVTLTISNGTSTSSKTKEIFVSNVDPVADFTCFISGNIVDFEDLSYDLDGSIVSYYWDFGDGDSSTLQNPTHTYYSKGPHLIILNVTDDDLSYDKKTVTITLSIGPAAEFSYNPFENIEISDTISFTDNSLNATSWSWDFGDGGSSTLQNPTHNYNVVGTYDVTLTVYDEFGFYDSITHTLNIEPENILPFADFAFNPNTPKMGNIVDFTDLSTDSDGSIVSWFWDFGDGVSSTIQNPSHSYQNTGIYTINLEVTDDDGDKTDISKTIEVLSNAIPNPLFSYNPSNPTIADTIDFSDQSYDSDGSIVSWFWDFGDGSSSTLQNPNHQYVIDGNYTVTLTVTDNDNSQNSYSEVIFVEYVYEYLDQSQEIFHTSDNIKYGYYPMQSFIPTVSKVTRIEVFLKKSASLSNDITMSLKDAVSGNIISSVTKSASDVSSSYSWISFNFTSVYVNPGEYYYIMLSSDSYSWSKVYYYGHSQYNTYSNGILYKTTNAGRSWSPNYYSDMCFRVYGI